MKIAYLTDMDIIGSGYRNLSVPICEGLAKNGHDVKVIGLGYSGEEHNHTFSLLPALGMEQAWGTLMHLITIWEMEVLIVAFDIPLQGQLIQKLYQLPTEMSTFKYVGIMPVEADPLCKSWAMILMQMDKPFIISEFGATEARKAGIMNVEHLQIGIDTEAWRVPNDDEKAKGRQAFGLENSFVVLTVADNQERKNLSRSMEIFASFAKDKDAKYVLVTREHSPVGWKLTDYAQELGIQNKFVVFERGKSFQELWLIYATANAFLLTSKAEGLGMPLLEAMAMKIPIIATKCTAISELLAFNRGLLIDPEYSNYRDPFGNAWRYFASKEMGVALLEGLYSSKYRPDVDGARKYVEGRTWDITLDQMENALKGLKDGEEK